jgi:hypothetical protein
LLKYNIVKTPSFCYYKKLKNLFNYLAHMVSTVVDVFGAIFPRESSHTVASVMGEMVYAFSPVFAGRKLVGAKGDFGLAKVAGKAAATDAGVLADAVDTG